MVIINDRDKIQWIKDMTVSDVLQSMGYEFTMITVAVNGELVSEEDYDSFPVPDNADINIFHLAHGG
ncbi:MAG: sulfur carrier protein ThiS [Chitinispirillia bacterium]|jgi:thiamine biosynthesis protein ThiS